MKKYILLIILVFGVSYVFAQTDYFNYQAVIRDNSGELIKDQNVRFRISIIIGNADNTPVFQEIHSVQSNAYGVCNLKIGNGSNQSVSFNLIDWSLGDYFMNVELDETGGESYKNMGTVQLLSVPFSLHAQSADQAKIIDNPILSFSDSDTLFAVRDLEGNIVFAVFADGVEVYVNETAKGKIGGFAVSGRSPSKATTERYLSVTADSTQIFVNQPLGKGKIGGFAVSGRTPSKGIEEDYLVITPDSTRIYVNQTQSKGKIGGFAVSGRSPSKGTVDNFLDITPENYFIGHESGQKTTPSINTDHGKYNVFLGYQTGMENLTGLKNVFIGYKTAQANTHGMTNVYIGSESGYSNTLGYDNVFIGSSSGHNNTEGLNNVFLGSRSGFSNVIGVDNVFVGYESGFSNMEGVRNTFIGNKVGRANTTGSDNIFIGELSGFSNIDGSENIFIGKRTGQFVESALENTFIGSYSGQQVSSGTQNTFLGHMTGLGNTTGSQNTYLGGNASNKNDEGSENVSVGFNAGGWSYGNKNTYIGVAAGMNATGDSSVFIGYNAGFNETGSQKLYIENSNSSNPLIYGEFDNDQVVVNGSINYGIATGTDTYVVTMPSIVKLIEGMAFYIKFKNSNTASGSYTININNLGNTQIIRPNGVGIGEGELRAGSIYLFIYDGANFQLLTM